MKRTNKTLLAGALVGAWMLGPGANEAHAYIDPGTGSSLLPAIGLIFAVIQMHHYREQRRETAAIELLRSFHNP